MTQLVFIREGQAVTDSLTVAREFGKDHDHVMRDIRQQLKKLQEADETEWSVANFGEAQYQHPQNKQWYPKFDMTEDAFAIVAMSYTTPEAMKMKVKFITEFKRMRNELTINTQALSPELQMFNQMFQAVAKVELENSQLKNDVNAVKQQLDNQAEILALNPTEWRKKVRSLLNKIAQKRGGHDAYSEVNSESYELLEQRGNCKLGIRQENIKKRMALEGAAKSKINAISKLEAIAEDSRLTEIYLAIVKEMAIKHSVKVD
ncbi:Rha family transcriptional regulator [Paenibacillus sp. FSL R7-0340]|uniref:Rha family transcriptional regulator n=1 Tax=Paenibacillus sp. FSL R7-0340 TaxID=2921684 RepID=UPI0030F9F96A